MPDYTPESRPYLRLCDLPAEERPRERLDHVGERALSTTELLAIVIGSGHGNDNVLHLAQLLLSDLDGLSGVARASTHELRQVKGIGEVKAAQIKASLELGRRATKGSRRPGWSFHLHGELWRWFRRSSGNGGHHGFAAAN